MARMIDLIKGSAVPANIMRAASRGALSVPAAEMVEILVYLAAHAVFGEHAQLTLAGWDEASARVIAADPGTSPEVLNYLSSPRNLRPCLLTVLTDNPSVPESRLARIASLESRDVVQAFLASERVRQCPGVLRALVANRKLAPGELEQVNAWLGSGPGTTEPTQDLIDTELSTYLNDHADEIKAADEQSFFLHGWTAEEEKEILPSLDSSPLDVTSAAVHSMAFAAKAEAAKAKNEKQSTVQKIAKMKVGERVQLAMKGNKDDRFILVRDGARVVCNAVIESPKLTDSEVETFAGMKNVQESVLRAIASKRKFIKSYAVIRTLTSNPRCPLDVALPLLPHLLTMDMKHLSMNKNVADTLRKMATKMFRERLAKKE